MSAALCEQAHEPLAAEEEATRKVVYLTFDDGPCRSTLELLELLKAEGVPATFFLIGNELLNFPEAVRAIVEDGHAIGCHSYYHQRSLLLTKDGFRRETQRFDRVLEEVLGHPLEVRLFRFPFGSTSTTAEVRRHAADSGYLWIDWNASNYDTHKEISRSADKMLSAAIRSSRSKDIIVLLLHENRGRTREMLPALLQFYRDNGYVFDVLTPDFGHTVPNMHMGLPSVPVETASNSQ
ncbi:MAG: polysaccharide deacetylase family protein [Clostridia bacterium]|nr:polysaccharide deacetylase family protein [Clostridia bacterium]